MGTAIPHDSAACHVTGEAVYVDDIAVSDRLLVGRVVTSPVAHALIRSFDLEAARRVVGVHAVLSASDIPGHNQVGPVIKDEPCLAAGKVECVGQAVFLIAAGTEAQCREAESLISVDYDTLPAVLDIPSAMAQGLLLGPPRKMERGNAERAFEVTPHRLHGELHTGAQEHWYLETQVALCIPGEGSEMQVYSSTQHPSDAGACGGSARYRQERCRCRGAAGRWWIRGEGNTG